MRTVRMRVRWLIEETVEVTITDVSLPAWSDQDIVEELGSEMEKPCPGAEFYDADPEPAGGYNDRTFNVAWGQDDE